MRSFKEKKQLTELAGRKPTNKIKEARKIKDVIIQLYLDDLCCREVAEITKFNTRVILEILIENNIPRKCANYYIRKNRIKNNPKYSGAGEITTTYWSHIQDGAKTRGLEFSITKEYAIKLLHNQEYRCKLSNVDIRLPTLYADKRAWEYNSSLDRIDSKKGYIEGNVQWIHKSLQKLKWDLDEKELYDWCKLIHLNLKTRYEKGEEN